VSEERHLPRAAPIDAYGDGGFRFDGMSHRGSLLCLPDGIWASPVANASEIDEGALSRVFDGSDRIKHCLIGTGADLVVLPKALRQKFRDNGIAVETMATGAAVRTYNILLGENRPVAALLIAVD
jgi:uncharacterized protein